MSRRHFFTDGIGGVEKIRRRKTRPEEAEKRLQKKRVSKARKQARQLKAALCSET